MATVLSEVRVDLAMGPVGAPADVALGYPGWLALTLPTLPEDTVLVVYWNPTHGEVLTDWQLMVARASVAVYRAVLEAAGRWDVRGAEDRDRPALYVRRLPPLHRDGLLPPQRILVDDKPDYAPAAPLPGEVSVGERGGHGGHTVF